MSPTKDLKYGKTTFRGWLCLLSEPLSRSHHSVQKIKILSETRQSAHAGETFNSGATQMFISAVGGLPEEPPSRHGSAHWEKPEKLRFPPDAVNQPHGLSIWRTCISAHIRMQFETEHSTFQCYLILREHAVNVLRGQTHHQTMLRGKEAGFFFFFFFKCQKMISNLGEKSSVSHLEI